jgi:DNA polymerase-1
MLNVPFPSVVVVDTEFEFGGHDGNLQRPVCLVARELRTGREWRLWRGEFGPVPPFSTGPDTLFVAFVASAELNTFRALGWPMPARILDLFAEFRVRVNGLSGGRGLIDAMAYFGLDAMGAHQKEEMRQLILRGGPWSDNERAEILDYCAGDVDATTRLLRAMLSGIDLPRALLRGRYMAAVSAMEFAGVPLDVATLQLLRANWANIQDRLIADIDVRYGVFDGRTFKADLFERFLARHSIPWPRLETGRLALDRETFKEMARSYSIISPLRELRHALADMRLNDLTVGDDGRNRTSLWAFGSKSGRNQPSNTKFIFGPSVWLRGLIKPPPGHALAYIDWSTQEVAIAAALSGDENLLADLATGDPYIAFGVSAGILPPEATKETHGDLRQMLKACMLGVQYGMGARTLALRISQPEIVARELLRAHRNRYRKFWRMADGAVACAMQGRPLSTVFGWRINPGANPNPRSALNFPMQANGAEMLRLACCLATERGIEVCAPIHDAVLICAPLNRIDDDVARMCDAMGEAARAVLGGFSIPTDVAVVRYPERFSDKRGVVMWERVTRLLERCSCEAPERISAMATGTVMGTG